MPIILSALPVEETSILPQGLNPRMMIRPLHSPFILSVENIALELQKRQSPSVVFAISVVTCLERVIPVIEKL